MIEKIHDSRKGYRNLVLLNASAPAFFKSSQFPPHTPQPSIEYKHVKLAKACQRAAHHPLIKQSNKHNHYVEGDLETVSGSAGPRPWLSRTLNRGRDDNTDPGAMGSETCEVVRRWVREDCEGPAAPKCCWRPDQPQKHHTRVRAHTHTHIHTHACKRIRIRSGCYCDKQSHLKGSPTGSICLCVHKIATNVSGGGVKYTKENGSLTGRGVKRRK